MYVTDKGLWFCIRNYFNWGNVNTISLKEIFFFQITRKSHVYYFRDVDDDEPIRVSVQHFAMSRGPSSSTGLADVLAGPQGSAAVDYFLKMIPPASSNTQDVNALAHQKVIPMTPPQSSTHSDVNTQRGQDFVQVGPPSAVGQCDVIYGVGHNILQITPPASSVDSQEHGRHVR